MSCDRARALMIDALVEPLDDDQRAELRRHTAQCASCAADAARYAEVWQQLGSAAAPEVPGLARLEARILDMPRSGADGASSRQTSFLRTAASALALVGLGVMLALGFNTLQQSESQPPPAGDRYLVILTGAQDTLALSNQFAGEMRAWVGALQQQSIMESFELVAGSTPEGTPPSGLLLTDDVFAIMVIRALSAAEARRIAQQSPTLSYGGRVEVRGID